MIVSKEETSTVPAVSAQEPLNPMAIFLSPIGAFATVSCVARVHPVPGFTERDATSMDVLPLFLMATLVAVVLSPAALTEIGMDVGNHIFLDTK